MRYDIGEIGGGDTTSRGDGVLVLREGEDWLIMRSGSGVPLAGKHGVLRKEELIRRGVGLPLRSTGAGIE